MGVKGYFIQYKFIIPETVKHSSYTYQKLFRALYGYTQAVFKSNGKVYHYHRAGILSDVPYLRPGKNCVIIPPATFQKLIDFFKTGRNPTHQWKGKGDWKAVYYMNEKDIEETKVIDALKELIGRSQVETSSGKPFSMSELADSNAKSNVSQDIKSGVISRMQPIVESAWFKEVYQKSPVLKEFYGSYKSLKSL